MLKVANLVGGYSQNHNVINGICFRLEQGMTLSVFGHNGAGKSTLARAIMGLLPATSGSIEFRGKSILGLQPEQVSSSGIGFFWQGGRVFQHLSVWDNLRFAVGSISRSELNTAWSELTETSESFLTLNRHQNTIATYLSGGERHLLALAMVLIRKPALMILDEPSAGLAPAAINDIYQVLQRIQSKHNTTILLIEQNINKAISCSQSCLVLRNGLVAAQVDLSEKDAYQEIERAMFDMQEVRKEKT